jgi:hypothetical protein
MGWLSAAMLVMVIDLALAIITVECALLLWSSRAGARQPGAPIDPLLLTVLSGLGLLLALRAAAVDAHPAVTLAALTLGGLAHVADMAARLRKPRLGAGR